jgi:hypothetical protein
MYNLRAIIAGIIILFSTQSLCTQEAEYKIIKDIAEPVKLIGLNVQELFAVFGPPTAVYPVRGIAEWQDDVVFVYKGVDFYLSKDHVWQVSVLSERGINIGDPKSAVILVFGEAAVDNGSFIIIPSLSWQIDARYNIDIKGKVSEIYIYRTDY